MEVKIKIAEDFSISPNARFRSEGENSGEEFRDGLLISRYNQAKQTNGRLIVDLDGVFGYATSFLEESFGGIIRNKLVDGHDFIQRVEIISEEEPYLIDKIKKYMNDAIKK